MKWAVGILLGLVGLLIVSIVTILVYAMGVYNELVVNNEDVNSQWGQVENVYQRRADLIPNLAKSAEGYAIHENETFTQVIEARAKATSTNINIGEGGLNATNLAAFSAAQGELSSALSRLMAVVENYPELKANTLFQELMSQLEGTENRISVERRRFNEKARAFNTYRNQFPRNFIAGYFSQFAEKPYFEAREGSDIAPEVNFDNLRQQ